MACFVDASRIDHVAGSLLACISEDFSFFFFPFVIPPKRQSTPGGNDDVKLISGQ